MHSVTATRPAGPPAPATPPTRRTRPTPSSLATSPRRRLPPPPPAARTPSPSSAPDVRPGVDADAIPECDLDDDELAALLGSKQLDEAAMAVLRDKMRARTAARAAEIAAGGDPPLRIRLLRPVDPFDAWVWFRAARPLSPDDVDLLDGVWTAWHLLGRLGGFNGSNLQLFHGDGIATEAYDGARLESAGVCTFHDAGDVEAGPGGGARPPPPPSARPSPPAPPPATAHWARAWINMGTADELALDVLANALGTLAKENVPLTDVVITSAYPPELGPDAWPLPPSPANRDLAALGLSPDAMGGDTRDY